MQPEILPQPQPAPEPAERTRPRELLGRANVGLQARLLLGDFTTPSLRVTKQKLRPIKEQGAQGISQQTAGIYREASLTQRHRYQQETGLTYARWREGFDGYLQEVREDTAHVERKAFLETLGITDTVSAEDFYNEYLRGKSDIVKFVDDVEIQASREQIQKHQDIIRQLGNAFGYQSSEVIEHLIHGVRNVKDDIDGFVKQASKQVKTSDVVTHPLLRKTQEDGQQAPKKPAETQLPPQPRPTPRFRPTPVTRADLDDRGYGGRMPIDRDTLPRPAKPAQVFPAPVTQPRFEDLHLITAGELEAAVRLLYGDVYPQDQRKQKELLRASEVTSNYARELHAMMEEYGRDFILEKAGNAVRVLEKDVREVGLKTDKRSRSQSWYLWGIAKSRFLANNPAIQASLLNADKYDLFDPLLHYKVGRHTMEGGLSYDAEQDIIDGMLGWEAYRQRKKIGDILLHLDPVMAPRDKDRLRDLLNLQPKPDTKTLSSYQLRQIGRLIRANKQIK